MKVVVIPELVKRPLGKGGIPDPDAEAACSSDCPFYCSDDVCSGCNMGWAVDGRERFHLKPGPQCPGPGEYSLEKITRPPGEHRYLRLHNEDPISEV